MADSDTNISLSFNEALSLLDNASSESLISSHWVPSLQKDITIKDLTAKQQKKLLNAAIDNSSGSFRAFYTKIFYNIIKENVVGENSFVDKLTYIDRIYLSLSLRQILSNILKVQFEDKSFSEVNLSEILGKLKSLPHPSKESISIIRNSLNITIDLAPPTFELEVEYFEKMPKFQQKETEVETLKEVLSESYIYETSKYIDSIKIAEKDLNYKHLNLGQKYTLLEKLPASVVQKVIEKIATWKASYEEILTISSETGSEKLIEVDSMLFLSV
jgi:hypothetical protein